MISAHRIREREERHPKGYKHWHAYLHKSIGSGKRSASSFNIGLGGHVKPHRSKHAVRKMTFQSLTQVEVQYQYQIQYADNERGKLS